MKLRERLQFLERERERLERLLALSLRVATHGTDVSPTALLSVLEDVDRPSQPFPIDRLLSVLRETAP